VLVTTGPHRYEEPAVILEAKKLGIPILAFITSWDNLSTKNRPVFKFDGYLVWSKQMKKELYELYPHSHEVPVYIIGAPQFDVFFEDRFRQTREEFCAAQGLQSHLPIILYALGSPNFLPEYQSVTYLAEKVAGGELGDVQLLVRPHPIHDNAKDSFLLRKFAPRVMVQQTSRAGTAVNARSQDENQITEWVNSFRHADVVVNLSSTAAVDAALFDRPVVNLDFDPQPGQPNQALVKDINHQWTHFKPVAESGGLWLVNNFNEMIEAIKTYLTNPELHRDGRKWIAEFVCEYLDGLCGERMARAVIDFTQACARRSISA
jgi:CDP-glycerol glycerophosphotransferase (TagB/SpsB family)